MRPDASAPALIALAAAILVGLTLADVAGEVPLAIGLALGALAIALVVIAAFRSAVETRRAG